LLIHFFCDCSPCCGGAIGAGGRDSLAKFLIVILLLAAVMSSGAFQISAAATLAE
jgi:hypothetical protein